MDGWRNAYHRARGDTEKNKKGSLVIAHLFGATGFGGK